MLLISCARFLNDARALQSDEMSDVRSRADNADVNGRERRGGCVYSYIYICTVVTRLLLPAAHWLYIYVFGCVDMYRYILYTEESRRKFYNQTCCVLWNIMLKFVFYNISKKCSIQYVYNLRLISARGSYTIN